MITQSFNWDEDGGLPVKGATPAAKHASATGAAVAGVIRSERMARILAAFSRYQRLTIAGCSTVTGMKEASVCSCWNAMEHKLGWIEGTGTFETYAHHGRTVKREIHRLTAAGKRAAFSQTVQLVKQREFSR